MAQPGDLIMDDATCWPDKYKVVESNPSNGIADGLRVTNLEPTAEAAGEESCNAEAKEEEEVGAATT